MPGKSTLGLLAKDDSEAYHSGRHLYHATKPPVVPLNADQEAKLRADGYQDEYVFQEYPKVIVTGWTGETPVTRTVLNAEDEATVLAAGKTE